jgi:hypothetical protein
MTPAGAVFIWLIVVCTVGREDGSDGYALDVAGCTTTVVVFSG